MGEQRAGWPARQPPEVGHATGSGGGEAPCQDDLNQKESTHRSESETGGKFQGKKGSFPEMGIDEFDLGFLIGNPRSYKDSKDRFVRTFDLPTTLLLRRQENLGVERKPVTRSLRM